MSRPPAPIVEAYAGTSYPQRPLRVFWRNRWHTIAEVQHQEQHPDRRCFIVRLAPARKRDDIRLRLCYHYRNDTWSVEPP